MDHHPITILAYHRISSQPLPSGTWVHPGTLASQLDALQTHSIPVLDCDSFLESMANEDHLTRPSVLITFDDATEDIYHHRHLFERRGIKPVVFVPLAFVGEPNHWEWAIPGRRTQHCTASQLVELAGLGWEIGLHGVEHRALPGLDEQELEMEIPQGRTRLEELIGAPVRLFSYPYGLADSSVANKVAGAGFSAAFVMAQGPEKEDPFLIPRRPVYCIDSVRDVMTKVHDGQGATLSGRWQHWKEGGAHGVGRVWAQLFG